MAWPFAVPAPSFDSGFVDLGSVLATVPNSGTLSTALWLMGATFANETLAAIMVDLVDGAGATILPAVYVPANATVSLEWAFMPVAGLQWRASAIGLTGKVWGYK